MSEVVKFIAARVASTVVSYLVYVVLLYWLSYDVAYFIAYVAGIVLSYVINSLVVFKQPITRRSAILFPLIYLVQFLMGMLILRVCIERLAMPEWLGMAFSIVLTFPLAFALSRWAMREQPAI
ncbi:GtrA family protein [Lysobacter sp. H21R4]|uniref:GtrA family protein n=1 Tax=Lysobacter sp. H21R4 TaxID=2781021 RepID=UPI00188978A3|nr:GtrA family protein [Lysobacter sp. H21R4]QOY62383.1 GtrA family protein [Lysobacter sp. H21R4]